MNILHLIGQLTEKKDPINIWMWISIFEFCIIAAILFKSRIKHTSKKRKFKEDAFKENVDFDNIISSSFQSIALYDELKVKCHPDRFPTDSEKNAIAESLFQEITKNKTNLKKLLELKQEAIQKLNINL